MRNKNNIEIENNKTVLYFFKLLNIFLIITFFGLGIELLIGSILMIGKSVHISYTISYILISLSFILSIFYPTLRCLLENYLDNEVINEKN